ncbi:MAG: MarR family transcriptional regulator [Austwickia sp.]|jgi:DNA-binding MarR family transcriptional regulator|nr:MAG: MarR family transcriptional regulator [Austwickia sp.]
MTTGNGWLDDNEQRIWRQWLDVATALPAALGADLAAHGLSLPDYGVLVALSESPDHAQRVLALAERLGWERSRASHHLTRMEKRDLVRRTCCPDDARGQLVTATPEGLDRLRAAAPDHVAGVRRYLFDGLDAADVAALDRITAGIIARLADRRSAGGAPN